MPKVVPKRRPQNRVIWRLGSRSGWRRSPLVPMKTRVPRGTPAGEPREAREVSSWLARSWEQLYAHAHSATPWAGMAPPCRCTPTSSRADAKSCFRRIPRCRLELEREQKVKAPVSNQERRGTRRQFSVKANSIAQNPSRFFFRFDLNNQNSDL